MAGYTEILDLQGLERWAHEASRSISNPDFRKPLEITKRLLANDFKKNFSEQHDPDGTPWPAIHARPDGTTHALWDKGALVRSTGAGEHHIETMGRDELIIGTNMEYASIHQYGGTINAQPGRALSVPLSVEAKRAGGASHFPRPLTLIRRSGGPPLLVETNGRRGITTFHYVLLRSVTIPQRAFIGIGQKLADTIAETFANFIEEELQ